MIISSPSPAATDVMTSSCLPVAQLDVVELGGADGTGAAGVDRGEHQHRPG